MGGQNKSRELLSAAKRGEAAAVARWIKRGAAADGVDGENPLLEALSARHWEAAEALITGGANPNALAGRWRAPLALTLATERPDPVEVLAWLFERGADPNGKFRGSSLLHALAAYAATDEAKVALRFGADPNARSEHNGQTPLIVAAERGGLAMMALLLEAGADPSVEDCHGRSAMDWAREAGSDGEAAMAALSAWAEREELCAQLEAGAGADGPRGRAARGL